MPLEVYGSATPKKQVNADVAQHMMVGEERMMRQVQHTIGNQGEITPAVQCCKEPLCAVEEESIVSKCARFFMALLQRGQQFDQQHGQQTFVRMVQLVKMVISGEVPPEDFTNRLQRSLRPPRQLDFLPFLQKAIPALREAMQRGEVVIEGIELPPTLPSVEVQRSPQLNTMVYPLNPLTISGITDMPQVGTCYGPQQLPTCSQTPHLLADSNGQSSRIEVSGIPISDDEIHALPSTHASYWLFNVNVLAEKIHRTMPNGGQASHEVITMISQVAEKRLREVLVRLSIFAEHRLEPLRNHPSYQVMGDTRRQLHFLEELDRHEYERMENLKKEELIRLSKSKNMDKDIVEKVKQLQRADQEAARNRNANAAAMAALGSAKNSRSSWIGVNKPFGQPTSMELSGPMHYSRMKTVTMRDFEFMLSNDPLTRNSALRLRLSVFGLPARQHTA